MRTIAEIIAGALLFLLGMWVRGLQKCPDSDIYPIQHDPYPASIIMPETWKPQDPWIIT